MKQKIKIHKIFKHFFINANNDNIYLDENGMLFQITEYDINGNKILEISYDDEGNVIEKYEYVYNDNNNIVSKIIFFDEEIIAERIVYVRNEKEQIISEERHYESGSIEFINYEYNETGKLILRKSIDEDNECEWEEFFEYDNDNLISEIRKDYGKKVFERKIKYDEAGNVLEIIKQENNEYPIKQVFDYDNKGNEIKNLIYNHKNILVSKSLFEYDEKSQVIKIEEQDVSKHNTSILNYDAAGNQVMQEDLDIEGNLIQRVVREYNENNEKLSSEIIINKHGFSVHYMLKDKYQYFEKVEA